MRHSSVVLVFAVRQPPLPLTSGAAIRTHRLLTRLAAEFPVTMVTYAHQPGFPGRADFEEVRASLPRMDIVAVPGLSAGKRATQLASVPRAASWQWGRYAREEFRTALRRTVVERSADLVHFEDLGVAALAPVSGVVNAFAPHNVEHRIIRGVAGATSGARRAFAEIEWRKIKREEERAWRSVSLCLAVSEIDAAAMRAGGAGRVALCPNGTDPVPRLPAPSREKGAPLRVLFVGTATYPPYERGLAWLIRDVLPLVRERVPAIVDVVGAPPPRPIEVPGVEYHGRVSSVADWYVRAHAVVVPVFEGSGTRLKILEAIAYGRPVVSTGLGSEGLPVKPGVHYLLANDAPSFAAALVELAARCATGDPLLEKMLAAAHDAVSHLSWPRIAGDLANLYREELKSSGKY